MQKNVYLVQNVPESFCFGKEKITPLYVKVIWWGANGTPKSHFVAFFGVSSFLLLISTVAMLEM